MFSFVFDLMFTIVPIFIFITFIFVFLMIISPRFRAKMMSRNVRAAKYMMDESKDDIKDISDNMAYATKDGIKTTTQAVASGIKAGLSDEETVYCKYCGSEIDSDSVFCKKCGKEQ